MTKSKAKERSTPSGENRERSTTNTEDAHTTHYSEDEQVCDCGHLFRDHASKSWSHACCAELEKADGCRCRGFSQSDTPK